MKKAPDRDWPATIALTVLLVLTLVFAVLDPSCQQRGGSADWRAVHGK